jgi:antitoxin MazE
VETIVSKWGNSLGLRLPKEISSSMNITNGSKVNISLKKSKIEISLIEPENLNLDLMLSEINQNNIHGETTTGLPIGNEAW